MSGADDRPLGRSVEDDDLRRREDLPQLRQQIGGHQVAAGEQRPQPREALRSGGPRRGRDLAHQAGHGVEPGRPLEGGEERGGLQDLLLLEDLAGAAAEQGREQLEQRDVEGEARQMRHPVAGGEAEAVERRRRAPRRGCRARP